MDNNFHAESGALTMAFSSLGVDEKCLITILGSSNSEQRSSLRICNPNLFIKDEHQFERWDEHCIKLFKHEFMRFKNAIVLQAMHPWERDARLVKEALKKGPQSHDVIVEIACTRSSEELLGARKAYHSIFDLSMEEDVFSNIVDTRRMLFVALISAYRYEGLKIREELVKSEVQILASAIKNGDKKNLIEDENVIVILATRSKPHLKALCKLYNEAFGRSIGEDLEACAYFLHETIECLCAPSTYFSKVVDGAMKKDAHKNMKRALTRVVVTRADIDMKEIEDEYNHRYGLPLLDAIKAHATGNYKDLLVALITEKC